LILEALLKLPSSYWLWLAFAIALAVAGALLKTKRSRRGRRTRSPSGVEPSASTGRWQPQQEPVPVLRDQAPTEGSDQRLELARRAEPWMEMPPATLATLRHGERDISRWSLELLRALEWKRFEILCAKYFEAIGFRSLVARAGADGGVDIHLYMGNSTKPGIIVQCKAWNAYKVGVKPVRELFGVMAREGVPEGIFVTTGQFTEEARTFPRGNEMHLWDGDGLLRKIAELPADKQTLLLRAATEGDYTTPTCPSCVIKMLLRTSKKDGERFWGCENFRRGCRQTFKYAGA
jgi:restriction system protein